MRSAIIFGEQHIAGCVEPCPENAESHRVIYDLPDPSPLVSIDHSDARSSFIYSSDVSKASASDTDLPLESMIVDNGSTEEATREFFRGHRRKMTGPLRVRDEGEFNFSRLINRGTETASGEMLAFLNNDIEATEPNWLREMVSHAVRAEVGAVGARLWYPDGELQHGGVVLGSNRGVEGMPFIAFPNAIAPMNRTLSLWRKYFCRHRRLHGDAQRHFLRSRWLR